MFRIISNKFGGLQEGSTVEITDSLCWEERSISKKKGCMMFHEGLMSQKERILIYDIIDYHGLNANHLLFVVAKRLRLGPTEAV